ncbi:uncharacterized protein LOC126901125 [Daktulosphaira vitifoliae]|uniref:uncharacterized protein LOC126901125 n=1 Tax=Daktulosphaira vitifoliae TaxID=58002 RepID=UPI0021AA271E|nr:uncharacterized protein LOC126901125 [Daktulosphaira vitifoliae]
MAIPFNLPTERDAEDHHYLRIENLLKELLTLLRWTPWTSLTGVTVESLTNTTTQSSATNTATATATTTQRRRQTVRGPDHHRRSASAQQQQMPDLVTSCSPAKGEKKPSRTVFLQVELCPKCYYNGQKLKVVGVTKLEKTLPSAEDQQNLLTRISAEPITDAEQLTKKDSSKVKRRLMSLLQPSKIDSSILTAVFVIIGWKMFIKQ